MPFTRLTNPPIEGEKKDYFLWKFLAFLILGVISAGVFGYSLKLFFLHSVSALWPLTLSFVLFLVIIFLENVSLEKSKMAFWAIFGEWLALVVAFNLDNLSLKATPNWPFWAAAIFVLLLFFYSRQRGRNAAGQMIKIRFLALSKAVLPSTIAALFFFASAAYVYGVSQGNFIPPQDFKIIFNSTAALTDKIYPGWNLSAGASSTVGDLLQKIALSQAEQNPQFSSLPESFKKQFVVSATKELNKKISESLGQKINPNLSAADAAYEALKNKIADFSTNSRLIFSLALTFLIFLSFESVALFVRWLITPALFIIYEILVAADFMSIEYEGVSKEKIVLK